MAGDVALEPAKVIFDVASPEIALPSHCSRLAGGVAAAPVGDRRRGGDPGRSGLGVGAAAQAAARGTRSYAQLPGHHGGAFPSGHTTSAVVCVALLLAWVGWPRLVTGRVAVNAAVVVIVGGSAIYLNYHYFSDVIGGVVLGLLIATLPLPVFRRRGEAE